MNQMNKINATVRLKGDVKPSTAGENKKPVVFPKPAPAKPCFTKGCTGVAERTRKDQPSDWCRGCQERAAVALELKQAQKQKEQLEKQALLAEGVRLEREKQAEIAAEKQRQQDAYAAAKRARKQAKNRRHEQNVAARGSGAKPAPKK